MQNIGNAITCPCCAKQQQRSCRTESVYLCPRCGTRFYVYLKNDVQLTLPAPPKDEGTAIILRDYVSNIIKLMKEQDTAS